MRDRLLLRAHRSLDRSSGRSRRRLVGSAVALVVASAAVLVAAAPAQALIPTKVDVGLWGVNGRVRAIVQTPNAIYIGGKFTALVGPSGQTLARTDLAAISPTTGQPLDWAPPVNNIVWSLALSPDGTTVYAGGQFTKVGVDARATSPRSTRRAVRSSPSTPSRTRRSRRSCRRGTPSTSAAASRPWRASPTRTSPP